MSHPRRVQIKPTTILGSIAPVVAASAVFARLIVSDTALAAIFVVLGLALIPGIVENYRKKTGWNLDSTVMTTVNLLMAAAIFGHLGLWISFITLFAEGLLWLVLTVQSIVYMPEVRL